jgi:hypothetical protein
LWPERKKSIITILHSQFVFSVLNNTIYMKKTIYMLVLCFLCLHAHTQLANSKWKTTLHVDPPIKVVFYFSADTLVVTNAEDSSTLETLTYSLKDTVLTLQKLYGQSGCNTTDVGTYSCLINTGEMHLRIISDVCDDRSDAIGDVKLTRAQ